jgi:3-deoxy-D-manno-octulosonic-acid transferase
MRGGRKGRALLMVYRCLLELAVWCLLVPWELLLGASGRGIPGALCRRLGRGPVPLPGQGPRILVHAVSVGETNAARPLLAAWSEALPGSEMLLTSGNRAGLEVARDLAAGQSCVVPLGLLPWDRQRALNRWLQRLAPDLVVVVETELWPGLFHACAAQRIPLALVNGRLYPRDLAGYRLVRPLMARTLDCAALIGVQNGQERERFIALGADPARIRVLGNSKLDAALTAVCTLARPLEYPFLLGVSTHHPEERWLMRAFQGLRRSRPGLRLVLAPRHPGRTGGLLQAARGRGWRAGAWSRRGEVQDWDVLVLDGFGLLPPWLAHAELVFVGGSLAPHGGHNPLEPAAWGRPLVMGPHTGHFGPEVEFLRAAGGLLQLVRAAELEPALDTLLKDLPRRRCMGERARAALAGRRGAARSYARALAALVVPRGESG